MILDRARKVLMNALQAMVQTWVIAGNLPAEDRKTRLAGPKQTLENLEIVQAHWIQQSKHL